MSTIMFANVELDSVSFGFGVVSLLSSLISIGFGTGLMYVLGDVAGDTLKVRPIPDQPRPRVTWFFLRKSEHVTRFSLSLHSRFHRYAYSYINPTIQL